MEIEAIWGKQFRSYASAVTSMRLSIFREWPYFYAGDEKVEADYSRLYAESSNSLLIIGRENGKIIGVTTGLPLEELDPFYLTPFQKRSVHSFFYLGEILLLKEFRGRGLGLQMHAAFESEVRKQARYNKIYILRILCDPKDPRKPKEDPDLDRFWHRLGYIERADLNLEIEYQEIGRDSPSLHLFQYSFKDIG